MMPHNDRIQEAIDLFAVPERNGIYVLGCFARYATLYSQQVRALNLIYLLNQYRKLGSGKKVAVIGGGAAGLTAAVAAARLGASVRILEKLARPMGLQRKSLERYIHPHIYDWPLVQIATHNAQLPIFSWDADYADAVARRFLIEWGKERARYPHSVAMDCEVRGVEIGAKQNDGRITVTWNAAGPHGDDFDFVILAVGFGLEEIKWADDRGYWHNDQLDKDDGAERVCLVSGYGDGGLTDLMRLCIRDFKHDSILRLFAADPRSRELGDELFRQEELHLTNGDRQSISRFYQNLDAPHVQEVLQDKKMLRTDTEVFLTGLDWWDVYSSRSSILNRFIVSQLARMGRWNWMKGPIEPPPTRDPESGKYRVRFKKDGKGQGKKKARAADYTERVFDIVVLRHGPKSALKEDFRDIWDACETLSERWETIPPHLDPTRTPLGWGSLFDRPLPAAPEPVPPPLPNQFKLVAFDIDGTLLQGDRFKWSWRLVWFFLGFNDDDRRRLMNQYLAEIQAGGEGWHDAYKNWCDDSAILFKQKGLKRSDFAAITKSLRPVNGLSETIEALKRADIRLAIISGGIDQILTEKLSEYLEDFQYCYVNKFLFDTHGLFTGVEATKYDFRGKMDAVLEICDKHDLSPEQVVFVGDGFNDLALIGNVGRTICFAGTDTELEQRADVNIVYSSAAPDLRDIIKHIVPT
ncbi:MAG TPA: HAD-IB family phosphatase [Pirellulales bacterium]|nr:HAD-IB family phosphatase [Pirellulales bacterium]